MSQEFGILTKKGFKNDYVNTYIILKDCKDKRFEFELNVN